MRRTSTLLALLLLAASATAAEPRSAEWSDYLDYAYVYSSAEPAALRERLGEYARETGIPLEDYVAQRFPRRDAEAPRGDETALRREAIAHLLHYLAKGDPEALSASVAAVRGLEVPGARHEDRYWVHYVMAHDALEKGDARAFARRLLSLWLEVVVPLESPFEILQTLSLGESRHGGFASALPYVFENVSRLILIRSQRMRLDHELDPLTVLVRLLYDRRVGAHPEVIPAAASSRDYLQRIVERLDGPESDAGSLTFTLALFEASRYHDEVRALLAEKGLASETLAAIRVASGAYQTALRRARTVQGRAAVHTRVLRQLGEIFAAKQRLGVDPDIETPFGIEGAVQVYATLQREGRQGGYRQLGFRRGGREAWLDAMHRLWEEIQETSLNIADYYLAKSLEKPHAAGEHSRNAARTLSRYLSLFEEFATRAGKEAIPDAAYFAAYEAGRGFGDALLAFTASGPSRSEADLAIERYLGALRLYPFERALWSSLALALERQGREGLYLSLVRPIAESVTRSRHLDLWIENGEPGAEAMAAFRRALSDDLVLMYLGFAESTGIEELEEGFLGLRARRDAVEAELAALAEERDRLAAPPAAAADAPLARPAGAARPSTRRLADVEHEIASSGALLDRLEKQIEARERAMPLYRAALESPDLTRELRARRDHPIHTLLRRMHYERSG